jgi:hypothetical protein
MAGEVLEGGGLLRGAGGEVARDLPHQLIRHAGQDDGTLRHRGERGGRARLAELARHRVGDAGDLAGREGLELELRVSRRHHLLQLGQQLRVLRHPLREAGVADKGGEGGQRVEPLVRRVDVGLHASRAGRALLGLLGCGRALRLLLPGHQRPVIEAGTLPRGDGVGATRDPGEHVADDGPGGAAVISNRAVDQPPVPVVAGFSVLARKPEMPPAAMPIAGRRPVSFFSVVFWLSVGVLTPCKIAKMRISVSFWRFHSVRAAQARTARHPWQRDGVQTLNRGIHLGLAEPDGLHLALRFAFPRAKRDLRGDISKALCCATGGDGRSGALALVGRRAKVFGGVKPRGSKFYLWKHFEAAWKAYGIEREVA